VSNLIDLELKANIMHSDKSYVKWRINEIEMEHGVKWEYEQKFYTKELKLSGGKGKSLGILKGYEDYLPVDCPECGWNNVGVSKWDLLISPVAKKCNRGNRFLHCEAEFSVAMDKQAEIKFVKMVKRYMEIDRIAEEFMKEMK
jgi:hypothetical protein